MIPVNVECYSGFKAEERPIRFSLGGRTLEVVTIVDRWYGPSEKYFRIEADDGNTYILRHDEGQDQWSLQVYAAGVSMTGK
jgi:hypothetical protein